MKNLATLNGKLSNLYEDTFEIEHSARTTQNEMMQITLRKDIIKKIPDRSNN